MKKGLAGADGSEIIVGMMFTFSYLGIQLGIKFLMVFFEPIICLNHLVIFLLHFFSLVKCIYVDQKNICISNWHVCALKHQKGRKNTKLIFEVYLEQPLMHSDMASAKAIFSKENLNSNWGIC